MRNLNFQCLVLAFDPISNYRLKFSKNTYIKTKFQYKLKSSENSRAQKKNFHVIIDRSKI